jgi:CBS domain-containing protein
MTEASAPGSSQPPDLGTVAAVMKPPVTTVELNDHVAAAAYLMKHGRSTSLVVMDSRTDQPIGIITDTDVAHAVADGKDVNDVRIRDVMTQSPTVVTPATSVRDAAELMTSHRFRHLPVVDGSRLVGVVDIDGVCLALLGSR